MGARRPFGSVLLGGANQSTARLRVRVQLLLTALLIVTELIGAIIVVAIAVFALPTSPLTSSNRLALFIATPAYVALAVLVGLLWATRSALKATRWVRQEREPTTRERKRVLRLPLKLTMIQAILWAGAFVSFGTLAIVFQPDRLLGTGFAIVITGAVVAGVTYLLSEFTLRPVAARALAGPPLKRRGVVGVGGRQLLFWTLGTAAPVVGLAVSAIVALTDADVTRQRIGVVVLSLSGVILVFGLLVTLLNSRAVVAPVNTLRRALARVGRGNLDAEVTVFDGTELGRLQAGFNDMVAGLREREQIRDMFGRHVGHEVAAAATSGDVVLGGETRTVTVLFVDLTGSTSFAQHHDPQHVVQTLNAFFEVVIDEVERGGGLVNKFMGDAALVIFGAPVDLPDHAAAGLRAGRAIAERLPREVAEVSAGIGVATGEAVAGNIGGANRFEYTVIGDAVNSAARLCDLAKKVPGCLLTTRRTVEAAAAEDDWVAGETVTLRGRDEQTETMVLRSAQRPADDSVEVTTGSEAGTP